MKKKYYWIVGIVIVIVFLLPFLYVDFITKWGNASWNLDDINDCNNDEDCTLVYYPQDCCKCGNADVPINKKFVNEWNNDLDYYCSFLNRYAGCAVGVCVGKIEKAKCINEKCKTIKLRYCQSDSDCRCCDSINTIPSKSDREIMLYEDICVNKDFIVNNGLTCVESLGYSFCATNGCKCVNNECSSVSK